MFRFSAKTRLCFGLVGLQTSLLLMASMIGLIPDPLATTEHRNHPCLWKTKRSFFQRKRPITGGTACNSGWGGVRKRLAATGSTWFTADNFTALSPQHPNHPGGQFTKRRAGHRSDRAQNRKKFHNRHHALRPERRPHCGGTGH